MKQRSKFKSKGPFKPRFGGKPPRDNDKKRGGEPHSSADKRSKTGEREDRNNEGKRKKENFKGAGKNFRSKSDGRSPEEGKPHWKKEDRNEKRGPADRRDDRKQHDRKHGYKKDARIDKFQTKPFKRRQENPSKPHPSIARAQAINPSLPNRLRPNLYGFHAVEAAWLNPERTIKTLYLTEAAAKGFEPALQKAQEAGLKRPVPVRMDKEDLEKFLQRGAVHQGVAAIAEPLPEATAQDLIIMAESRQRTVVLMLDQVTDPHNVGAILRSACAFGAAGVIMQRKHAPELEGVLAKTATGAIEHLPVAYEINLSRALEEFKEAGFFVFGLDERGEKDIGKVRVKDPAKIVLVLGSEGDGLRRLVKENCDELVKLPTQGAIASLNVSNAAAVALYAFMQS